MVAVPARDELVLAYAEIAQEQRAGDKSGAVEDLLEERMQVPGRCLLYTSDAADE